MRKLFLRRIGWGLLKVPGEDARLKRLETEARSLYLPTNDARVVADSAESPRHDDEATAPEEPSVTESVLTADALRPDRSSAAASQRPHELTPRVASAEEIDALERAFRLPSAGRTEGPNKHSQARPGRSQDTGVDEQAHSGEAPETSAATTRSSVRISREAIAVTKKNGYEDGKDIFEEALRATPSDNHLWHQYAIFASNQSKSTEAVEIYDRAVKSIPGDRFLIGRFAVFLEKLGRRERLEELYQTLLSLDDRTPRDIAMAADFYGEAGNESKARELFEKAVREGADDSWTFSAYAQFEEKYDGDFAKIDSLYKAAVHISPTDADLRGDYAIALEFSGDDPLRTQQVYEEAVSLDESNSRNLRNFADYIGRRGQLERACELFSKARSLSPLNRSNYLVEALVAESFSDYSKAEKILRAGNVILPDDPSIIAELAMVLMRSRSDDADVSEIVLTALKLKSENAWLRVDYGVYLAELGRTEEARGYFEEALRLEDSPWILSEYARAEQWLVGNTSRALELLKRASSYGEPAVLSNYALFLERFAKNVADARYHFERSIESAPDDVPVAAAYAGFLARQGEVEAGRASLERHVGSSSDRQARTALAHFENSYGDQARAGVLFGELAQDRDRTAASVRDYAGYLEDIGDFDAADRWFKLGTEWFPTEETLGASRARFLFHVKNDLGIAESEFRRVVRRGGASDNTLSNFVQLLFTVGHQEEATEIANRLLSRRIDNDLRLELSFYWMAHVERTSQAHAGREVRRLLNLGVRSPGWNLTPTVERAVDDGFDDADELRFLANRIAEEIERNR